jgi:hypothetical protein
MFDMQITIDRSVLDSLVSFGGQFEGNEQVIDKNHCVLSLGQDPISNRHRCQSCEKPISRSGLHFSSQGEDPRVSVISESVSETLSRIDEKNITALIQLTIDHDKILLLYDCHSIGLWERERTI